MHDATNGQFGVGAASWTNEAGTRAWILSHSELDELRQRLKTLNGVDLVNAPGVTVADGTSASVSVGQTHPPTFAFVGITVDVTPKIASHHFQLAMSAVCTELNQSTATSPIRTNLSAACRVSLPNAGGILIKGPDTRDKNATNYWLILSPTAIDAYGKPIKL